MGDSDVVGACDRDANRLSPHVHQLSVTSLAPTAFRPPPRGNVSSMDLALFPLATLLVMLLLGCLFQDAWPDASEQEPQ